MNLEDQFFRVFILGAGFSRPAGFPLAAELWQEILRRADGLDGRAGKFHEDLEDYLTYQNDIRGGRVSRDDVDFEDFMSFLDVEHYLGLRGPDTWSEEGNEGTIVTKYLICKILAEHLNEMDEIPCLYLNFVDKLQTSDTIITFNYDTLLETALEARGRPYRLYPNRYKSVSDYSGAVDNSQEEIVVLKVHGSIDWFDRTSFERRIENHESLGARPPSDIIFSNETFLGLEKITEGPRFESDPMRSNYRAKNLQNLCELDFMFHQTPRMLAPSSTKLVYSNRLNDFWHGMSNAGLMNFGLSIIGFSLPPQDEYTRQILYRIVKNYQGHEPEYDFFKKKKAPLTIVDRLPNNQSQFNFKQRYRFVDWNNASFVTSGFDENVLDLVFGSVI